MSINIKAFLSNDYQMKHADDDSRSLIEHLKQYLADQVRLRSIEQANR
jgi:hypothetical protein